MKIYEGNEYDGEWREDKANGKGIKNYKNGDKYEGEFANGEKHGKGAYFYSTGDMYKLFFNIKVTKETGSKISKRDTE